VNFRLFRSVGDLQGCALAAFALGNILFAAGEVRQAVNVLEHCLLLRRCETPQTPVPQTPVPQTLN
jgi:hypothetical protein